MKQIESNRWNKKPQYSILITVFLILLTVILPVTRADTVSLPTRGNPGMTYDSESDKIVIFGGWNLTTVPHQDTWIFDYNIDQYTKRTPSIAPRRRAEPGIIYDSLRDNVILFGGRENQSTAGDRDDTWTYDYNSNSWTQLFPVSSPSARRAHRMVYDSESDRIILFGGKYGASTFYNETWVGNPGSNTWQLMNPAVAPPARAFFHMVYDSESDRIILFGGHPGGSADSLFDTWAYDYNTNTWENLTDAANHPPARSSHIMAYDSQSDRIVLFGGGILSKTYDDTWLYNYNTNTWQKMSPATSPSARCRHEAAYDSESDRVIIYGGTTGPWLTGNVLISTGKTWAYDVNTNTWTQVDTDFPIVIVVVVVVVAIGAVAVVTIIILRKRRKK